MRGSSVPGKKHVQGNPLREKPCRGNLSARFGGAAPDGKAPDSAQTPSPLSRVDLGRLGSPLKRLLESL